MSRTIQPELLDTLPPNHPDALHSRRDLRLINRVMGNHRWIEEVLRTRVQPGERLLEVGAGTGELVCRLNRVGITVDGLDFLDAPEGWPESHRWHSGDLRTFDRFDGYRVIVGNLVFHHFDDSELAQLGTRIRRDARLIVACEPARRRIAQVLFRVFGPLFGASHVTLHDGHVSIAGGFLDDELPTLLGLHASDWIVERSIGLLGGYRMIATRRS